MTMHVVLGDGEMPKKALTETLQDLWERAEADQQSFWFLVRATDEPTSTDRNLMSWIAENEIYFETVSDSTELDDIYDGAQSRHVAKRLAPKIVNLMKSQVEEDEEADVLALFVSDEAESEEDAWLYEVIQATGDAGYKTFALNDGLMEVEMGTSEEDEDEVEEEEEPVAKAAAKKAAPPAKKATARRPTPEDEKGSEATGEITREFLENQTVDTLKKLAANRGIELPPRTRSQTYIDRILGEDGEVPEAEVDLPEESEDEEATVSQALLVVVYNGGVYSRPITPGEAEELMA